MIGIKRVPVEKEWETGAADKHSKMSGEDEEEKGVERWCNSAGVNRQKCNLH